MLSVEQLGLNYVIRRANAKLVIVASESARLDASS